MVPCPPESPPQTAHPQRFSCFEELTVVIDKQTEYTTTVALGYILCHAQWRGLLTRDINKSLLPITPIADNDQTLHACEVLSVPRPNRNARAARDHVLVFCVPCCRRLLIRRWYVFITRISPTSFLSAPQFMVCSFVGRTFIARYVELLILLNAKHHKPMFASSIP